MTLEELLNDPVFVWCAPVGLLLVVVLIVLFGGGGIEL
jgi:hypothetical protein